MRNSPHGATDQRYNFRPPNVRTSCRQATQAARPKDALRSQTDCQPHANVSLVLAVHVAPSRR
jgi:hypothetical protein